MRQTVSRRSSPRHASSHGRTLTRCTRTDYSFVARQSNSATATATCHEARRAGVITRVRHGAYVTTDEWESRDEVGRYRLRGQAVCLTHEGHVALSHTSGAAEHGLRLWQPDLKAVHVVRLDKTSGRRHAGVVYHEDTWQSDDVFAKEELLLLAPEACALGAASITGVGPGLVILDSVLDLDLGDDESLWAAYSRRSRWPHSRKLQITIRLARHGAQSIGESLGRHLMLDSAPAGAPAALQGARREWQPDRCHGFRLARIRTTGRVRRQDQVRPVAGGRRNGERCRRTREGARGQDS